MTVRVPVSTPVLEWAQRRSGRADTEMQKRFSKWEQWLAQEVQPTFKQVEDLAAFTYVPVGYLFLAEPPQEELPIADFRLGRGQVGGCSSELLDTIYLNQRRQAWYEDYLADLGADEPLPFVGIAATWTVAETAHAITQTLHFTLPERQAFRDVRSARNHLIEQFEHLGGLVVINGVVGNSTRRPLDLEEFRGFTLQSETAPLVFVNGHDTFNGQIFSLLHEFAHIWRGECGLSAGEGMEAEPVLTDIEAWCNQVAAAALAPLDDLSETFDPMENHVDELERLSKRYWCSTLVVLLQLKRLGAIRPNDFDAVYEGEVYRLKQLKARGSAPSGGDFYKTQPYRIGRTLSRAIIHDTNRGNTPMTEALRLLGFSGVNTFDGYAKALEVA